MEDKLSNRLRVLEAESRLSEGRGGGWMGLLFFCGVVCRLREG